MSRDAAETGSLWTREPKIVERLRAKLDKAKADGHTRPL
jgi:hypothetical protein